MRMKGDQSPTTAPQVEVLNMMEDMSLEGMMKEKVGVGHEDQEEVGVGQEDLLHTDQPQWGMWGDHDLLWGGLGHQTDSKARTQIFQCQQ